MKRRRRRDRRRGRGNPCQRCGAAGRRLVGSSSLGVQIRRCTECGMMDQRLPGDRRVIPSELVGAPRPLVVVLELVAVAAIAAAAAIALLR